MATYRLVGKEAVLISLGNLTAAEVRALKAQGDLPFAQVPAPTEPCVHLGGPTGERVACPTCSGRVELKVMGCTVHGRCTPTRTVQGVQSCLACPDRVPGLPT